MSQPARPTLLNRNATLAPACRAHVGRHRDDRAGAGADAVDRRDDRLRTGRIALTRSPVMRVKAVRPLVSILTSGPMISNTSPPDEKLPPAPVTTMVLTSSSIAQARKKSSVRGSSRRSADSFARGGSASPSPRRPTTASRKCLGEYSASGSVTGLALLVLMGNLPFELSLRLSALRAARFKNLKLLRRQPRWPVR
jgi:hypothetical protein